jgi:hypothetical protein
MEGKKRKVSDANFDPDGTESFRDDERRPVFSSAKALEERETRSGPGLPITLDDRKQVAGLFEDDDDEGSDGKREEERLAGAFMWSRLARESRSRLAFCDRVPPS